MCRKFKELVENKKEGRMSERKNRLNLIGVFLKAYWWVILIILIVPILLNFIIMIPAFSSIVGEDTDWLSFHGSYIGSVITSLITLYVLYKQLQHNHEENENTRHENQTLNEKKRQLQLKILRYEQEKQWLQEMRMACVNNTCSYNHNDVLEVCNYFQFSQNFNIILSKIKALMDRLAQTDTAVGFLMPMTNIDKFGEDFNTSKKTAYERYMQIIKDLQILAVFINNDYQIIQMTLSMSDFELSPKVKQFVETKIITPRLSNIEVINTELVSIAIQRSYVSKDIFEDMRDASLKYLKQQEERINKILTDTDGTR